MPGIPPSLDTDTEDVTWALQTAEALWKRNERVDALVWLRRAAQAAGAAEHDDRALGLAHDAAELAEWLADQPPADGSLIAFPLSNLRGPSSAVEEARTTHPDDVLDVSIDVTDDVSPLPPSDRVETLGPYDDAVLAAQSSPESRSRGVSVPPPRDSDVPSAAEKHAGMLDPWADSDSRARMAVVKHGTLDRPASGARGHDLEGVVTSAPPLATRSSTPPARVAPKMPRQGVNLSEIDALTDMPDDAREAFARAAVLRDLPREGEIAGFALAVVLSGSVELASTVVDASALRMEAGSVIRARGTLDITVPIRLIATSDKTRVATWDEPGLDEAFRTCPWVEDDLRVAGDRLQALVGVTMGPLGERFDPQLRAQVVSRLKVLALAGHEVWATRGKSVPGLLVVGAGQLELVRADGAPEGTVLRAGEFLFPSEVLLAAPAPSTARASKGGALVLFADRLAAQELLVTCPPLLEIFAGS